MNMRKRVYILFFLVIACGLAPLSALHAQDSSVTLSLAVPTGMKDVLNANLLKDFETANPGVTVNITDLPNLPQPTDGMDAYLSALQKYASAGDVVLARSGELEPQATAAGYFLDLSSFVNADTTLKTDDFYPTIWQAFQWDKGIWAMPFSANVLILLYDPAAFDQAGIAYPTGQWTLDDFVNAVNKLTVKGADGTTKTPAYASGGSYLDSLLYLSLAGNTLSDSSVIPNMPQLDQPPVENVLDAWNKLDQQGMFDGDPSNAPMLLGIPPQLVLTQRKLGGSLLTGGKSVLLATGFAVSAGTQYPEQSYALVKFLTTRSELDDTFSIPARKSLVGAQSSGVQVHIPADVQALSDQAAANSLSGADLRFIEYLPVALSKMKAQNLPAKDALQAVETQAVSDMQAASSKKGNVAIAVATPIPEVALASGKVALNFDLTSFAQQLPNKDAWDKVIQEFTANDPQVGQVKLLVGQDTAVQAAAKSDCFYLPVNSVPEIDETSVLSLDQLIGADQSFDKSDVVGNIMTAVQRDNKTWALPIDIAPLALRYNTTQFSRANLPDPANTWTVAAFADALHTLKSDSTGPAVFADANTNGVYLLALMADYGGIPLDFRTSPPIVNFTNPATVDAIRQVLDLAKQGYIKYNALGNLVGPDARPDSTALIYPTVLNGLTAAPPTSTTADIYATTLFPTGSTYTGLAYNVGTAYISAKAQNPEGCYRFISTISHHPELFLSMPARRSELSDPLFVASTNPDILAAYKQIDTLLKDSNTVLFPVPDPLNNTPSIFLTTHWLFEAFDSYVIKDADLDSALKDAELYARGYQQCAAALPDKSTAALGDNIEAVRPYVECAEKVDARLKPILDPLIGK